jgi:hypothetical protein
MWRAELNIRRQEGSSHARDFPHPGEKGLGRSRFVTVVRFV